MSILLTLLTVIFGGLIFLFFFWRRLKEDYSGDLILGSGNIILVSVFAGVGLASVLSGFLKAGPVFSPEGLWFWGGFLGFFVGFAISRKRFKLRTVESFEAGLLGLLALMFWVYLVNLSLHFVLITGLAIIIFYLLESKYRHFNWYKSGRVGFSGLAATGLYFLLRMILSVSAPGLFSMAGKLDLVFSGVSAFLLFFSLYNLSESA